MNNQKLSSRVVALLGLTILVLTGCMQSREAKSAKYLALGKSFLEKHDTARAILQFRNAVQASPRNAEAHYQLSLAYIAENDVPSAVASLRRALAIDSKHRGAQLKLAELMAAANDPAILRDAMSRLKDLMQQDPGDAELLNTLANTELKLGHPDSATEILQRALADFPGELTSYVIMARAKWEQKDAKGAEDALRNACKQVPKSVDAHRILAEFYLARNRFQDAEAELRVGLGLDPSNGPLLNDLARLQFATERKPDAEQTIRRLSGLAGYKSNYGVFLFQEGRRDEAIREFERVVKENPSDRQARTYLLVAYKAANRSADIDRVLSEALTRNGHDIDALELRAEIAMERNQTAQAEADLNTVAKLNSSDPVARYLLAKVKEQRGEGYSYRQALMEALRLNPALVAVRIELADSFINAREGQAALNTLDGAPSFQKAYPALVVARNWALWANNDLEQMRKGINLALANARRPEFLVQDGFLKLRSGDIAGARAVLEEALKADPANVLALQAIYRTYVVQKQSSAGLQKIREFAAREPASAPVQILAGQMLLASGQLKAAEVNFRAAQAADPQSLEADLSLAQVDYANKKYDEGLRRLQAIVSSHPDSLTAQLWVGIFEQAKGDYKAAIEHYRVVVGLRPDDAQASNNLAYLMAEHGDGSLDEALKYAQKAVELAPSSSAYNDTLGWILYKKGLYPMAIKYLQDAGKLTNNVVWKYHLAMAYAKSGDVERGHAILQAALKINPNVPEAGEASRVVGGAQ